MRLGVDALLQDPGRLAALGRPACRLARSCRVTDRRLCAHAGCPDGPCGPAAHGGLRSPARDARRQAGQHDRDCGLSGPAPRHPGVQPLRRGPLPTDAMLETFDVLLVDLQDIGTRIYTYVTTLAYLLDACAAKGKALWVLDRPNPAGAPVEGSILEPGWESFVGAAPLIMRHGLTFGELALWLADARAWIWSWRSCPWRLSAGEGPGFGWPLHRARLGQSQSQRLQPQHGPLFSRHRAVRGTTLSEGRGTTRRWRSSARRTSISSGCCGACPPCDPSGWRAVCSVPAGSSPPFTSTPASCAPGFRSTPTTTVTGTSASGPIGLRPSCSRPCAGVSRTTRSGAISPTSTRPSGSPSTCSAAGPSCASG